MSKAPKKGTKQSLVRQSRESSRRTGDFDEVLRLIDAARHARRCRRQHDADRALLEHRPAHQPQNRRGRLGQGNRRSPRRDTSRRRYPNARGFSAQNLWRMRQFFETYRDQPKLSALLRELSWTHNLLDHGQVASGTRNASSTFGWRIQEKWPSRELERQTRRGLVRACRPVADKTLSTAERIAPRRRHRLQG